MGRPFKRSEKAAQQYANYKRLQAKRGMEPPYTCPKCHRIRLYVKGKKIRQGKQVIHHFEARCTYCGFKDSLDLPSSYGYIDAYNFICDRVYGDPVTCLVSLKPQ